MRHYRDGIHIVSGWNKTCTVIIDRRVPSPKFFSTKVYNPKPQSAERFQNVVNDMLKRNKTSTVEITMLGDTLFVNIEE